MNNLTGDLRTLSSEAYVYLYPLVIMEVTRQQSVNVAAGARPGAGPPNQFHHIRRLPRADARSVVRPNFDTLYSMAWLDLTRGPVRVHVPDSEGRYYMLPVLDMWTDVVASPGTRTTGAGAHDFVITGPGYAGDTPAGMPVITVPTPFAWIIGRTQANGPDDYAAVNEFQDGMAITDLAGPAHYQAGPAGRSGTEPVRQVNEMTAAAYFRYAARALKANPPHATDFSQLARMARMGIVPGTDFDPTRFGTAELAEIEAGVKAARHAQSAALATMGTRVNGWAIETGTIGVYGNSYLKRAMIAQAGLGANPPEDAVYPLLMTDADGAPVTGDTGYVLHFDAAELPPAAAFWSITMYDAEGYQVANELGRFALGDRDPLGFNADGSLDIYIQRTSPGPGRQANWLPAPPGPLGITMRLYAPRPEALDGTWSPPPARPA